MPTVLLRSPLAFGEIKLLAEEFPQFSFLLTPTPTPEDWAETEIVYGEQLGAKELEQAPRLRWIHTPTSTHSKLCLAEIRQATNLLVTDTRNPDVHQVAEYAMGALLASTKDFFYWDQKQGDPGPLWENPHRNLVETIQGKTLLQIGLGRRGSAIADYAGRLGMRVWGLAKHKTFHSYCHKTYGIGELSVLLPSVDVICSAPPRDHQDRLLGHDQFDLMKAGASLLLIGLEGVDEEALVTTAKGGKLRHIIIDAPPTLSHKSPLWSLETVTVTPGIAPCPETISRLEFHQFQYNFRRYIHADFDRMNNHV